MGARGLPSLIRTLTVGSRWATHPSPRDLRPSCCQAARGLARRRSAGPDHRSGIAPCPEGPRSVARTPPRCELALRSPVAGSRARVHSLSSTAGSRQAEVGAARASVTRDEKTLRILADGAVSTADRRRRHRRGPGGHQVRRAARGFAAGRHRHQLRDRHHRRGAHDRRLERHPVEVRSVAVAWRIHVTRTSGGPNAGVIPVGQHQPERLHLSGCGSPARRERKTQPGSSAASDRQGTDGARQSPTRFQNSSGTSARFRTLPGSWPG